MGSLLHSLIPRKLFSSNTCELGTKPYMHQSDDNGWLYMSPPSTCKSSGSLDSRRLSINFVTGTTLAHNYACQLEDNCQRFLPPFHTSAPLLLPFFLSSPAPLSSLSHLSNSPLPFLPPLPLYSFLPPFSSSFSSHQSLCSYM